MFFSFDLIAKGPVQYSVLSYCAQISISLGPNVWGPIFSPDHSEGNVKRLSSRMKEIK